MLKRTVLSLLLCCFITILLYKLTSITTKDNNEYIQFFKTSQRQHLNDSKCVKIHYIRNIDALPENVETLSNCVSLYQKFSSMFQLEVFNSSQRLGSHLFQKMKMWLNNKRPLLNLAKHQTVIMIHDIIRQRTTVFNPLRSKRPSSNSQTSSISYLRSITESSKVDCDFCSPFNNTAEDIFGRIIGKHSVSASNVFKLAKWHSLYIPFEHSMFNINIDIHLDIFNTSLKWFKRINLIDQDAKFPVFFMDVFPHAGASQMHVHAHGVAGISHYPGQFQDLQKISQSYKSLQNNNYWEAIWAIHDALGLSFTYKTVTIISPLVPQREHELWLLSEEPSTEFYQVLYCVMKMYQDHFQRYCFSLSGALPVFNKSQNAHKSLPAILFIGTRGDCASHTSDVSSLELYLFNNVNTDPYVTITTLQNNLEYYMEKYKSDLQMDTWS